MRALLGIPIPTSYYSMHVQPRLFPVFACALAALVGCGGCARKRDAEPPVATPGFTINHPRAALGSPVEITYRFVVAPNAPPSALGWKWAISPPIVMNAVNGTLFS